MVSDWSTCDVSTWDGSLSSSDFRVAAGAFAEKWKKFNSGLPEWLWIDCSNRFGIAAHGVSEGYLSLQNVFCQRSVEEDQGEAGWNENEESIFSDKEEPCDNATLVQCDGDHKHQFHFHVVYSSSYRIPVLFFRAYSSDGQPLNLDEIEKDLSTGSSKMLTESKWTFITQEEHPYLNRPWYTLHPCGTSEWMKLLFHDNNSMAESGMEQYLVSWFSVVGQVFGLRLPFQMLKSIN